jgi:uncharacterized repeat protein (TIGR02543 family)
MKGILSTLATVTIVMFILAACGGGGGGAGAVLTFTVTYNDNGSTGGNVPIDSTKYEQGQTVTVLGNTGSLNNTGYTFSGWNTKSDGSGTPYSQGQTFTIGTADVVLYAEWTGNPIYTVTYTVGGTVSGLTGALVVQNNDTDDLTITSNGTFEFATALAPGSTYTVSVKTNPLSQRCIITNGDGSSNGTDVSNVEIDCTTHNIVFVTSTSQTGNLGGLGGADAICAARASEAGLPGTYVAWLSTTGVSARNRLGSARGWIRPDSLPFADTIDDLTSGKIFYPPRLDEFGNDVGKQKLAVTGTTAAGGFNSSYNTSCQGWISASTLDLVSGGGPDGGTQVWTSHYTVSCNAQQRLYCFGTDQSNPLAPFSVAGRLAFVSSTPFISGGGIAAADTRCQTTANSAGLSGSYKALLATESASAASRFSTTGATWVRRDGVAVVGKASDLGTDLLLAPVNITAGGMYMENYGIWVGANSLSDVGSGETCSSWTSTSSSDRARSAIAAFSSMGWHGTASCDATYLHLWCLQE